MMHESIVWINGYLWSTWTFFLLMGAGILFTLWTRFCQFRVLTHGFQVIRGVYDDPDDPGAINHFQALSAALSATIGLGNIGGVALAIGIGGPGALFWMWMVGFLGMALKTIEITLAMIYRNTDDPDNPHGGAMWVIDKSLGSKGGPWKVVAKLLGGFFCVTCVVSAITGGNMFQAWNVAALSHTYFDIPKEATGIFLAIIVGLVVIGGIKRIGNVAGRLVPVMCILYLIGALLVLAKNAADLPGLFALVVESAFQQTQAAGAFVGGTMGFAFSSGLRRALFSNEAGQGSAPIAHAAAKTNEPAREGIVGGVGPFIDTICICTLTAMVILATGTWNRGPAGELNGGITLIGPDRSEPGQSTWKVDAPTDVAMLPELGDGDTWSAGSRCFLLARVPNNSNSETGANVVRIVGEVIAPPAPAQPDSKVALDLQVEWRDVVIDDKEWQNPVDAVELVNTGLYRDFAGAPLTAHAFDREFPGLGKWLVTIASWLFAISTMISWCYYGEQGVIYVLGSKGVLPYKLIYLAMAVIAPVWINRTDQLENIMDLGTGWMLWANMPIVLLMGVVAVRAIDTYFRRLDAGEFHPHAPPPITDVVEGKDVE